MITEKQLIKLGFVKTGPGWHKGYIYKNKYFLWEDNDENGLFTLVEQGEDIDKKIYFLSEKINYNSLKTILHILNIKDAEWNAENVPLMRGFIKEGGFIYSTAGRMKVKII